MKLSEIYSTDKTVISFEVFPTKHSSDKLLQEIKILKKYSPSFVSLTYGAGGSRNKSLNLIKEIQNENVLVMPHFTCITSCKDGIEKTLKEFEKLKIENILALRGDIPENPNLRCYEFNYANELVSYIKENSDLSVGVAGYPEGHIESPDLKTDIENLKRKVDAGADVIFTQLFFDNNKFYNFVERVRNSGINLPIVAGIMPVINKKQIDKMISLANIFVPDEIKQSLQKYKGEELLEFGVDFATGQCKDLIKQGCKSLHFFTLDKSYSTAKILDNIRG